MSKDKTVLAIDAGNTRLKFGLFRNDELLEVTALSKTDRNSISEFLQRSAAEQLVLSSVMSEKDNAFILDHSKVNCFTVSHEAIFPVKILYETPETLGIDRICNAVAAIKMLSTEYGLVIDIGTCIKFDLIDNKDNYLGGSISPGIALRYKSLNDYTANLPLLSNKNSTALVGTSTTKAIHSGVINGIRAEIKQMMQEYLDHYNSLTFFVTGGDAANFDLQSKNNIFADENLTLKGLYEIYKANF